MERPYEKNIVLENSKKFVQEEKIKPLFEVYKNRYQNMNRDDVIISFMQAYSMHQIWKQIEKDQDS